MTDDIYRKATADTLLSSINSLLMILNDACMYLIAGNDMAAWGTLILYDDAADDIKAAIRLHRSANRRCK